MDPVSGGEVRDKMDMYRGVGVEINDPFESFRKNKSSSFMTRMKARGEVRGQSDVGLVGNGLCALE